MEKVFRAKACTTKSKRTSERAHALVRFRVINWQYFTTDLYSVSDHVGRCMGACIDLLNFMSLARSLGEQALHSTRHKPQWRSRTPEIDYVKSVWWLALQHLSIIEEPTCLIRCTACELVKFINLQCWRRDRRAYVHVHVHMHCRGVFLFHVCDSEWNISDVFLATWFQSKQQHTLVPGTTTKNEPASMREIQLNALRELMSI